MLRVNQVSFSYGKESILKDITFQLQSFYNLAIIGESGCGKSTLLKLIYGLMDANEGTLHWNSIEITGPKNHLVPGMEFIKYLAQDFDLMPFVTVGENIGKYLSNFYPEEKKTKIQELLQVIDMEEFYNTPTKNLSGGQKQRVAIAQVLALKPQLLLLDEPFSHIDNFRKHNLRRNLFQYLKDNKISCILATHDSNDVLSFADETIIMKNGSILRHDNTKNVYQNPKNSYEGSLFGEINEIEPQFITNPNFNNLYYPFQLVKVNNSKLEVTVLNSYFVGKNYLIQSKSKKNILYFEHFEAIEIGEKCFLEKVSS